MHGTYLKIIQWHFPRGTKEEWKPSIKRDILRPRFEEWIPHTRICCVSHKKALFQDDNNEVPYILATAGDHILLGGDFNCILDPRDATGGYNYSRALQELL